MSSLGAEILFDDFSRIPDSALQITDMDSQFYQHEKNYAKKSHKADREKLRREKINEHFAELAQTLDPDRSKLDKASILIDSVQLVKELRAEIGRLENEHSLLVDESRELTAEKNELREEKASIKTETDQLQDRIQQQLQVNSSWMMMDPSVMMGATSFPYQISVPQTHIPLSNNQNSLGPSELQTSLAMPPFIPIATIGGFPVHPRLHTYGAFANTQLPQFCNPFSNNSHVERPYAQYPTPLHPMHSYTAEVLPQHGSELPTAYAQNIEAKKQSIASFENQNQPGLACSSNVELSAGGKISISGSQVHTSVVGDSDEVGNDKHPENLLSGLSSISEVQVDSNKNADGTREGTVVNEDRDSQHTKEICN